MPATLRRIMPVALGALTLVLSAGAAAGQSRDPLPDVRQRLKIEAQRVEKEVQDGRMRAYRLLRSDAGEALDTIKGLIGMLRKDTSLPDARRETLLKTLQGDINNLRALASARRASDTAAATRAAAADMRRTPDPRVAADGKAAYDTAARRIADMKGRIADLRSVRDRTGERRNLTIDQVVKSATPAASDYELPPDWLEKSKRRSPEAKLTEKERAILEALKKLVPVDYNMATFQSVIEHLSKEMGVNVLTDKRALEEVGITYDSPVTLRFPKPVTARTALKRVLADFGLTYVIRKENIEVTTIARAREMLTTRTYYIGDLMGIANPLLPPIVNQFQMIQAIGSIINSIQAIDPESWNTRGGPGSIAFDPVRMVLIIKQSAELHSMLGGGR